MSTTGWVVLGVIVVIVIWAISIYNGLVAMRQRTNQAFADIDVQLKQRHDLIPNLVETVKGYAKQESTIFIEVAEARAKLAGSVQSGNLEQMADANQALNAPLGRLLAISENYPQLKSDANFRALQDELTGTENRIATARQDYNETVNQFNSYIRTFPQNLTAKMFGHGTPRAYFEAKAGTDAPPPVKF